MMYSRHAKFLGLIVAATLTAAACSKGEAEAPAAAGGGRGSTPQAPGGGRARGGGGPVPVTTALVVQKDVPLAVRVIGSAEAYSTVSIRAQITGELTSVSFRQGDDVKKGQVLFTLDKRPLEAALAQAEANLQRDSAQLANAKAIAQRYQDLIERGIATKEQFEQARTNAAALEATVGADRAAVDNARVQLQYATIKSPIDGRTGSLLVYPGNLVRANDVSPLVVLNQTAPLFVTFGIPEVMLTDFKRYMGKGSINVEANPPNDTRPPSIGHITFIDNQVDQTTGTIKMKATFPNLDRKLWPGEFVNVSIKLTTDPDAIVAPTAAVQAGQSGQFAFVVKPDRTVELRQVVVVRTDGNDVIVKEGLKPGETVVTDGQLRLVPGSRVAVRGENAGGEGGGGRGRRGEGGARGQAGAPGEGGARGQAGAPGEGGSRGAGGQRGEGGGQRGEGGQRGAGQPKG